MKIRIDDHGYLALERRGKMLKQTCPFQPDTYCADYCPLFAVHLDDKKEGATKRSGVVFLSCGRGATIASDDVEIEGGVA
jgi:hypothetical protein